MTSYTTHTETDPIDRVVPAIVCDVLGALGFTFPNVPTLLIRPHDGLRTDVLYTHDDLVLYRPDQMEELRVRGGATALYLRAYSVVLVHVMRHLGKTPTNTADMNAAMWSAAGFLMRDTDSARLTRAITAMQFDPVTLDHVLHGVHCTSLKRALAHTAEGTRS